MQKRKFDLEELDFPNFHTDEKGLLNGVAQFGWTTDQDYVIYEIERVGAERVSKKVGEVWLVKEGDKVLGMYETKAETGSREEREKTGGRNGVEH